MGNLLGFLSYAHKDDGVDGGRVAQLGRDIAGHYEAITAESIQLFLDSDDLHWGDLWKAKVDEALSNVAFFIPVMTPRYFESSECQRELKFFVERADKWGTIRVILPILYINVPALQQESTSDGQMQLIRQIQWKPWVELRWADRESEKYRRGVFNLAQEIVRRVAEVAATDIVAAANNFEEEITRRVAAVAATDATGTARPTRFENYFKAPAKEDIFASGSGGITDGEIEEPGTLELLGAMEEAAPRLNSVLDNMTKEIAAIGEIMNEGAVDMQKKEKEGRGFAARLIITHRIAEELAEPVDRIVDLGQRYVFDLNEIDLGFKVLLPQLVEEARDNPDSLPATCLYLKSVRGMAYASREGLVSISGMVTMSESTETLSRDLRAPMRKLRRGLTAMTNAQSIMENWVVMMDVSGLDCPDAD